ncbi:unnamed protein product [Phytophthora fragariaefolia]|uniref:Unnamed protein product n=1 Tax=Phytophthora fragariaefolia TaxID=1490495 RepID=A0A9W6TT35_9STRA|nr:unnamed protein product [Phytophthora fragariaefolia]
MSRHWPILAPLHPPSPKREAPVPVGKSSGNTDTASFDNSRSHEPKPRAAGPLDMTTETQIILRAAPDALGAAGPAEHDADAPTPSEAEEKPPAPASKKQSGDPEETKGTSASKKHANDADEAKRTPASEKPTTGAEAERKLPASKKLAAAATKKKKVTASSKPAPKKPAVKKPAAKQLPNPMSPKSVVAVSRARALEETLSRRDDPPPATPEPQVLNNAGVDEGIPPELLQPENRQHLSDRSRQAASQTVGTKRKRETHDPRRREQLLALRYWTRDEGHPHYQAEAAEPATGVVSDQDAQRRPTGSRPDLECPLAGMESCQRLLDGQRTDMVALRARVQDVEICLERLQDVHRDLDCLRDRVWGLPGQIGCLGDEVNRLRDRCSQGEENDETVRQDLDRHLAWIRSLYDRVVHLEAQEARRVAALAPAPAPASAQVPSEQLVRVMADAFRQYSATQSTPQAQQPPPGDRV